MCSLKALPELRDLAQIPVPAEYTGEDPQRLRDYLTGYQLAWEIATRFQNGQMAALDLD